jgi:hypothetical protein
MKRKKTKDAWPGGLPVAVRHDPAVGVEGAVGRPAGGCSSLHHIRGVAAAAVYINNRVINQYSLKLPANGCSSLHHIRRVAAAAVYINNRFISQYGTF